jgi:hypothetical protein
MAQRGRAEEWPWRFSSCIKETTGPRMGAMASPVPVTGKVATDRFLSLSLSLWERGIRFEATVNCTYSENETNVEHLSNFKHLKF